MNNLHFIAIGGSVMHSLAIALKKAGKQVSGSDDQIFDPAKSRLEQYGILPEAEGWFPEKIHAGLDAVILGMHALLDNPELVKAQELGLPIYSFPEFIYEQSKNKQRIVVAGSYGKTTVTSMIMHVMEKAGRKFNYLVGAQVPGFENPVRLDDDAPVLLAEGDEYFASKLTLKPKFLLYKPHIAVLTGISWDHINVFPTEMEYIDAFDELLAEMPKAGSMIYRKDDSFVDSLVKNYTDKDHYTVTFKEPSYQVKNGKFYIKDVGDKWEMAVIGKHNMLNIAAAAEVCYLVGIGKEEFLQHISDFEGAGSRLEKVADTAAAVVYKDFAHAPIKVRETVKAVRELAPQNNLIACVELHTFSSLDKEFLPNYQDSLQPANHKFVYINKETFARKKMEPITADEIKEAFADESIRYFNDARELEAAIRAAKSGDQDYLLMMSSANFGGINIAGLGE